MDEFDAILNLESEWEEEGRKEGQKAGKQQGIVDGRLLGLEKGHELGHELGYYAGCAEAWLRLYHAQMAAAAAESSEPHAAGGEEHGTEAAAKSGGESENQCEDQEKAQGGKAAKGGVKGAVSERTAKNLKAIVELVETFPVDDLTDEGVTDRIDKIRAKFKVVVSQLGMVPQLQPETFSF